MRPQVRLLALLAALVAAVALVACGGGDDETSDRSATEILEETFRGGDGVESGRLTVALDMSLDEASGAPGDSSVRLTGPFDSAEAETDLPSFDLDLSISGQGQSIEAGAISTGDQGFLTFQGTDYALPDDLFAQFRDGYAETQRKADAEGDDQPALQALGLDPMAWVTDPEKVGTEDVGGTETEHVRAGVDVPALLEDLQGAAETAGSVAGQDRQPGADDLAAAREQIESATVDVFTGTDDLRLRRLVVDLQLQSGSATFTLEIAELDEPQEISAPQDTRPLEELVGQFEALFGAAAGGATGGTDGGATGGAGANQAYLECVQAAGQDLAAVQDCAKHL